MRRKLFAAVFAVVAATGLTACGGSDDPSVLKIGTEGTYAPFSFQGTDGALTGYDVEVARAVGDKLGRTVEFVQTPWDAIFAGLESKRFDVVANQVTITDDRKTKYAFSAPYTVSQGVVVTRADDNSVASLADVAGKTCAQTVTSNWGAAATEAGANVEGVEGWVQAIQLLKSGRVDCTLNDSLVVREYLKTSGDASVKIATETGETSEMAFAARQDDPVVAELDRALSELRADGTLARISEKYFGTDVSQ
ncbi:amino acid ABC transporter substrate-binding protein [Nocardia puris]|uniref:Amino acid ABC transporter substrate-binding protein (PAAT family) n=1 Tax=Nocardia puris TaxID=208602 RepID=A0A366DHC6_9NOCA|nr:amino acid ABC transporter substrate-binding protein [Nocardia puris]RBO89396.1 amino acid ABC transporter substrate-binding protein (PAAT family) [Nocardia puris]